MCFCVVFQQNDPLNLSTLKSVDSSIGDSLAERTENSTRGYNSSRMIGGRWLLGEEGGILVIIYTDTSIYYFYIKSTNL